MKKFLYLLLALTAMGCNDENLTTDEPDGLPGGTPVPGDSLKYYTVALDVKSLEGELGIGQEPLSKAGATNNLWWFQINSTPEAGGSSTAYAYGVFDRQENMTVKLAEGYTYEIYANLIKDGRDKLWNIGDSLYYYPLTSVYLIGARLDNGEKITNQFILGQKSIYYNLKETCLATDNMVPGTRIDNLRTSFPSIDRYYGVVKGYVPVANGKIAINMYRMQMGYRIEAQPFESGSLVVDFLDWQDTIPAGTTVTTIERDMQYPYDWYAIDNYCMDTTAYAQERINNMSGSVNLKIDWISADGSRTTNIYNDNVTLQRLKRTILKISLKQVQAHDNSVETKAETTVVTDGLAVEIEGNINDGHDTEITPGS